MNRIADVMLAALAVLAVGYIAWIATYLIVELLR